MLPQVRNTGENLKFSMMKASVDSALSQQSAGIPDFIPSKSEFQDKLSAKLRVEEAQERSESLKRREEDSEKPVKTKSRKVDDTDRAENHPRKKDKVKVQNNDPKTPAELKKAEKQEARIEEMVDQMLEQIEGLYIVSPELLQEIREELSSRISQAEDSGETFNLNKDFMDMLAQIMESQFMNADEMDQHLQNLNQIMDKMQLSKDAVEELQKLLGQLQGKEEQEILLTPEQMSEVSKLIESIEKNAGVNDSLENKAAFQETLSSIKDILSKMENSSEPMNKEKLFAKMEGALKLLQENLDKEFQDSQSVKGMILNDRDWERIMEKMDLKYDKKIQSFTGDLKMVNQENGFQNKEFSEPQKDDFTFSRKLKTNSWNFQDKSIQEKVNFFHLVQEKPQPAQLQSKIVTPAVESNSSSQNFNHFQNNPIMGSKTPVPIRQESVMGYSFTNMEKMEVLKQVAEHMSSSGGKNNIIRMSLNPASLGKVMVELKQERDVVIARFEVENQKVKEMLESGSSDLKNSLKEKGVEVFAMDVNIQSSLDENSTGQNKHKDQQEYFDNAFAKWTNSKEMDELDIQLDRMNKQSEILRGLVDLLG